MFRKLFSSFSARSEPKSGLFLPRRASAPHLTILVPGIRAEVERKEGVKIFDPPEKSSDPKIPACVDFYYEVSLQTTGLNPQYPKISMPLKAIFTKSLDDFVGNKKSIVCLSRDYEYTSFLVEERYHPVGSEIVGGFKREKPFPAHHQLGITAQASFKGEAPKYAVFFGMLIRQSDMQSPEWQAASSSPIIGSSL